MFLMFHASISPQGSLTDTFYDVAFFYILHCSAEHSRALLFLSGPYRRVSIRWLEGPRLLQRSSVLQDFTSVPA